MHKKSVWDLEVEFESRVFLLNVVAPLEGLARLNSDRDEDEEQMWRMKMFKISPLTVVKVKNEIYNFWREQKVSIIQFRSSDDAIRVEIVS